MRNGNAWQDIITGYSNKTLCHLLLGSKPNRLSHDNSVGITNWC